jgi:hypothetical protein
VLRRRTPHRRRPRHATSRTALVAVLVAFALASVALCGCGTGALLISEPEAPSALRGATDRVGRQVEVRGAVLDWEAGAEPWVMLGDEGQTSGRGLIVRVTTLPAGLAPGVVVTASGPLAPDMAVDAKSMVVERPDEPSAAVLPTVGDVVARKGTDVRLVAAGAEPKAAGPFEVLPAEGMPEGTTPLIVTLQVRRSATASSTLPIGDPALALTDAGGTQLERVALRVEPLASSTTDTAAAAPGELAPGRGVTLLAVFARPKGARGPLVLTWSPAGLAPIAYRIP